MPATSLRSSTGSRCTQRRDHPSLLTVTATEIRRLRRGFVPLYALLAPIVITVPLYIGSMFAPEGRSGHTWTVFSHVTLEFWGVLVPVSAGLCAALAVRADQDAWRLLLSYGVPRWRYFVAKWAALSLLTLLSSMVLLVMMTGAAALNGQLRDLPLVIAATVLPAVVGLATLAIAVLVATVWGIGPAVAVGVAGLLSGALLADKVFWFVLPFAWPMRVILPLAGIGPNGIALPEDSPLHDRGVIPLALVLTVLVTAVVLALGGRHLGRKEI